MLIVEQGKYKLKSYIRSQDSGVKKIMNPKTARTMHTCWFSSVCDLHILSSIDLPVCICQLDNFSILCGAIQIQCTSTIYFGNIILVVSVLIDTTQQKYQHHLHNTLACKVRQREALNQSSHKLYNLYC